MNLQRQFLRRQLWILLIIALLGWLVSVESYHLLLRSQSGEGTWCAFGEISDCEKAFQSEYSMLFGIPISLYGIVSYFLVIAVIVLGLFQGGPYLLAALFHVGLFGFLLVGSSLYFGWALFFRVQTLCILCITDYLINIGFALVAWYGWYRLPMPHYALIRWDLRDTLGTRKGLIKSACLVLLFAVLSLIVVHQYRWYYMITRKLDLAVDNQISREAYPWISSFPSQGPEDAPVQVVYFGAYECPFCRHMKRVWETILQRYPGAVQIANVEFPGNSDCNPHAPNNHWHPTACRAVYLAQKVREVFGEEAYFAATKEFYNTDGHMEEEVLLGIARQAGLSEQQIDEALQASTNSKGLAMQMKVAQSLRVMVLPTMLINGILIEGFVDAWALEEILAAELKRAGHDLESFRAPGTKTVWDWIGW